MEKYRYIIIDHENNEECGVLSCDDDQDPFDCLEEDLEQDQLEAPLTRYSLKREEY